MLEVDGSCLFITDSPGTSREPLLLPFGTTWDPASESVTLPNGLTMTDGETFELSGGNHGLDALARFTTNTAVIERLDLCLGAGSSEIAVIQQ